MVDYSPAGRIGKVRVRGKSVGDAAELVESGEITMGLGTSIELALSLHDPHLQILESRLFDKGSPVDYADLRLRVIVSESASSGSGITLTTTARSDAVTKLRRIRGKKVRKNVTPTMIAASAAKVAGLKFVGQPTAKRKVITRAKKQSEWNLLEDLADRVGFTMFVARGTLFFATQRFILAEADRPEHTITWDADTASGVASGGMSLAGFPGFRGSEDSKRGAATVDIELHDGDDVRPGDVFKIVDVPVYSGRYLVTDVTIPLGPDPVTITAAAPDDPKPERKKARKKDGKKDDKRVRAVDEKSAGDVVTMSRKVAGDPDDSRPADAFSGAEAISWAAMAAVEASVPSTVTGLRAASRPLDVAVAARTRGAVLFTATQAHLVVSPGVVMVPRGRGYETRRVGALSAYAAAGLVKGLRYPGDRR